MVEQPIVCSGEQTPNSFTCPETAGMPSLLFELRVQIRLYDVASPIRTSTEAEHQIVILLTFGQRIHELRL
jgi:hypothetical protein